MLYPYNNENWLTLYPIVLDGGSIYTWWAGTANGVIIGSMRLLANSSLDVNSGGRMRIWSGHTVTLNGHTLSLKGAGEKCLSQGGSNLTFTEGVVDLQDGTMSLGGVVYATNTTWLVGGALNMGNTLNVSNYVARYTGTANAGTGALNVYGTFKPSAHDKFYGCTMQGGSTIDLSSRTNALPLVSAFTTGANTLKFADNSTVYINAGNLKVGSKSPVITWDEKPANIRTVKFKNADPESSRTFVSRDDGVYALTGFVIIVK